MHSLYGTKDARSRVDRRGWTPNRKPPQRTRLRLKGATECATLRATALSPKKIRKKRRGGGGEKRGKARECMKEKDGEKASGARPCWTRRLSHFWGRKKAGWGSRLPPSSRWKPLWRRPRQNWQLAGRDHMWACKGRKGPPRPRCRWKRTNRWKSPSRVPPRYPRRLFLFFLFGTVGDRGAFIHARIPRMQRECVRYIHAREGTWRRGGCRTRVFSQRSFFLFRTEEASDARRRKKYGRRKEAVTVFRWIFSSTQHQQHNLRREKINVYTSISRKSRKPGTKARDLDGIEPRPIPACDTRKWRVVKTENRLWSERSRRACLSAHFFEALSGPIAQLMKANALPPQKYKRMQDRAQWRI